MLKVFLTDDFAIYLITLHSFFAQSNLQYALSTSAVAGAQCHKTTGSASLLGKQKTECIVEVLPST